jgi:hypothetical protein
MPDEPHAVDSPASAESVPQRSGPRSLLKKRFVGPHGPRAGWKVLVFVLILFAVAMVSREGCHSAIVIPGDQPSSAGG